jgi:hypothetical protein
MQPPPPEPPFACAPLPGPYFERDPRLDPPQLPQPGWFTDFEADPTAAHVKNRLKEFVQIGARPPDFLHLPAAELDWTVSPRFEVGYRLPSGFGEFAVAYRFIATDGAESVAGPDGVAALKSRLEVHVGDLDYASREFSLWPHWDMKVRVGFRVASVFFDSQTLEPFAVAAAGSGVFARRTSNEYVGGGIHSGVELARCLGEYGLSLYARGDLGILLGQLRQGFFEEATTIGADGQALGGQTHDANPQAVPLVNGQVGLRWQPPDWGHTYFFLGYQYEYWWNVGRLSFTTSRGELSDQGILLRAEFNF